MPETKHPLGFIGKKKISHSIDYLCFAFGIICNSKCDDPTLGSVVFNNNIVFDFSTLLIFFLIALRN